MLLFMALAGIQAHANSDTGTGNGQGGDSVAVIPVGQVFFKHRTAVREETKPTNGFLFGRAHVGLRARWNAEWKAEIILDAGKPTTVAPGEGESFSVADGSQLTMSLKFANVQWRPTEQLELHAGAVLQNHYIVQERFWGFRFLDQTFMDRYLAISSTDLGLIGYFHGADGWGADLAVTNGEGFRHAQDASSGYKVALGVSAVPLNGLQARVYAATDDRGPGSARFSRSLASLFLGWQMMKDVRLGLDMAYAGSYLMAGEDILGGSLFCTIRLGEVITALMRADRVMIHATGGDAAHTALQGTACAVGIGATVEDGLRFACYPRLWLPENAGLPVSAELDVAMEITL
ncbi:MAG: hypothetical protein KFF77_01025 [Bacteroidetes bacterium]|nr:hypothetical protein [Bacteroidota bacterium]